MFKANKKSKEVCQNQYEVGWSYCWFNEVFHFGELRECLVLVSRLEWNRGSRSNPTAADAMALRIIPSKSWMLSIVEQARFRFKFAEETEKLFSINIRLELSEERPRMD